MPNDSFEIDEYRAEILKDPQRAARYRLRQSLADLGNAFRSVRQELKLSQAKLAEAAGLDQADISRLENGEGERGPTLETLAKYAHALDSDVAICLIPKDADDGVEMPRPQAWAKL